ncbi:MAG: type IV pilus assembly protein PilQ [Planctomycetota bacterium]|jgi:type IV pilus assembly protein PilQ
MKKWFLSSLATVMLMASASAQVPRFDARVSLRIDGRQLDEVVDYIRVQSGANIVVMEGGDSTISLDITDIPWRDALDLAAESAGCVVESGAAGVLLVNRPERVTFVFNNSEITEVIDAIAAISGANVVVAPQVAGTISMRLTDVPWRHALEVAVKTLGFVVVEEERGVLRVVDPLTLQAQMETRNYQLRYLRPKSSYAPTIDSEFVTGSLKPATGDVTKDFATLGALGKALNPGGNLDYIPERNMIIIRDTARVHASIKTMIEELDVAPAQVLVDVKFISTTNSDLFNLGVDYGDAGPSVSISGGQVPITFPFNLGDGGFEDVFIANPNDGPFANPAQNFGNTVTPDTVFGALSFTGWQATLRLLQSDERTQVVQAPKIIALDGRAATIFVGETIRYAEAKSEQGQAGGLQLSVSEASGSPVEVGFQLLLIPNVIPGANEVMLEIIPKETSLSGTGNSALAPPGFDVFTIGASGLEGSIALPRTRSSTIVTTMMLESGQTAVVGGLTTDTDFEREAKVPLLGDIPLIGWLFRHEQKNRERRSLLVFITPNIVRTAADHEFTLQRELTRRREDYNEELQSMLQGEGVMAVPGVELIPSDGDSDADWDYYVNEEEPEAQAGDAAGSDSEE